LSCERLFTTIRDGAWHNLNELANRLEIPAAKLIECARDLFDKGIVKYQENTQQIKIEPEWETLLPDENLAKTD
jgi:predicted transcriptional regulator